MQSREKLLLGVIIAILVLFGGQKIASQLLFQPINDRETQRDLIRGQVDDLELQERRIANASHRLSNWRGRSLPPDAYDAQRLYQQWLTDLMQMNALVETKITPGRRSSSNKFYTPVEVAIEGKGKLEQIRSFLHHFYRADLMHRITRITLEFDEKNNKHPYTLTMTAEGLVVEGTADRSHLFPQTRLAAALDRGADKLTVTEAGEQFPAEGEFRIRIDKEYLTVTARAENEWTVTRGVDSTNANAYEADATVEMAPVHPDMQERSLDDFQLFVSENPFTKPPLNLTDPGVETAKSTFLVAIFAAGDDRHIVLRNQSNQQTTDLREGEDFTAGEFKATVKSIVADHALFSRNDEEYKVEPGSTLQSLIREGDGGPSAGGGASVSGGGPGRGPGRSGGGGESMRRGGPRRGEFRRPEGGPPGGSRGFRGRRRDGAEERPASESPAETGSAEESSESPAETEAPAGGEAAPESSDSAAEAEAPTSD